MFYVLNSNITKLEVGQTVRVEISSLSARDYMYGKDTISSIESNTKVDQKNSNSYYIIYANLDTNNDLRSILKITKYIEWG